MKGYYRRPLHGEATAADASPSSWPGRVLSALFPHLAGFVQPLAGEYAGRPDLLETVPFVEGWGVEIGLLIDLVANFGIDAIAQVDLDVREHRNRPLDELGPRRWRSSSPDCAAPACPSTSASPSWCATTTTREPERVAVEIRERPPMLTVPAYRARFGRELLGLTVRTLDLADAGYPARGRSRPASAARRTRSSTHGTCSG